MIERNAGLPPERRIEFRVGIHLGDVVEESDGDLMGDSVNIAARLEGIADPGGICLSEDAYRQVRRRSRRERTQKHRSASASVRDQDCLVRCDAGANQLPHRNSAATPSRSISEAGRRAGARLEVREVAFADSAVGSQGRALALTLLARLTLLVLAETAVLELFEQFVEAVAQGLLALPQVAKRVALLALLALLSLMSGVARGGAADAAGAWYKRPVNTSTLPNTGVICQEEMVATFCNVATGPNNVGYGAHSRALSRHPAP